MQMSSGFSDVDFQILRFVFNEDLYLIKEQEAPAVITRPVTAPTPVQEEQEAKASVSQKEVKKVAVAAGTEKEILTNQEFLSKVLQAVGIQWEEAGFIAFDKPGTFSSQVYLVFGIENQKLVDFRSPVYLNQVQQQENEKYIFTYSLGDLEKSKDKKKGLWTAMQEAFLPK